VNATIYWVTGIHQAPAVAAIAGVVVEHPAAALPGLEAPPGAGTDRADHGGEHLTGRSAIVTVNDSALIGRRAQTAPSDPVVQAVRVDGRGADADRPAMGNA
jgi:hypothetical protein